MSTGWHGATTAGARPERSLGHPEYELVDLFGNGLPTVLACNGQVRYWRNRGNGQFDLMRTMDTAPAGVRLADPGVQLVDADGVPAAEDGGVMGEVEKT